MKSSGMQHRVVWQTGTTLSVQPAASIFVLLLTKHEDSYRISQILVQTSTKISLYDHIKALSQNGKSVSASTIRVVLVR
jgi:hypothetical protein